MWVRHPVCRVCASSAVMARCSASGGREARKSAYRRPRAAGAAAITSGSSACAMSRPPKLAISAMASPSWPASSGANSSTPEGSRKHLKPATPASCSGRRLAEVAGHRTAPERDVGRQLAGRGGLLGAQRGHGHGRRDAVQRHIHDRGHPAGGRRRGRRGEPLPLGPAGLVHVHVAVHQPGQQHLVPGQGEGTVRRAGVAGQAGDDPVAQQHGRGPLALRRDDPASPDRRHLTHRTESGTA